MKKYEGITPPPWKAVNDDQRSDKFILHFEAVQGADGKNILRLVGDETGKANARLIADAPMLAEQVETLTELQDASTVAIKLLREQNEKMLEVLKLVERAHHFEMAKMATRNCITEMEEGT